ncbi:MAG: phenylalanine--tRNA ligase subunit beta [Candidatus Omnitrophota bacterium]
MPIVTISIKQLNSLLKQEYPMDMMIDSLEQLGCDVEDTVEINLYGCPSCGALNDQLVDEEPVRRCSFCGLEKEEDFEKIASDTVVRIDLLANRPDLFNVSGLSRALKGYLGIEEGMPEFACRDGEFVLNVEPSVHDIRPYIVCAEVDMPPLDHTTLRELMKLQENLHWGVGRDRKLASIGIYDRDTLTAPITYKAIDPMNFKFHPLAFPGLAMTPAEILKDHPKGTAYAHLLEPFDRYPVLIDAKGQTLSMPPIINSEETRLRIGSSHLFIDVTGTGEQAVFDALNILVSALTELGGTIRTVKINFPDYALTTPDLSPGKIDVGFEDARRWIGVDFTREEFVHCIRKMRLNVLALNSNQDQENPDKYRVEFPTYRSDIRHEVDVFEDIVIGYHLGRIPMKLVPTNTVGLERPEEKNANMVRSAMTGLGFFEVMTLNLNSEENHFSRLRMEPDETFVSVENPKTMFQKVLRSHLISGIMETLEKNRKKPVPQKMFEIGTVTVLNPETEVGINEYRSLAFGIAGPTAGYAEGRAVLDSILRELGRKGVYQAASHPAFIDGRFARIDIDNGLQAMLGEIHPEVLMNFNVDYPVVYCELKLSKVY